MNEISERERLLQERLDKLTLELSQLQTEQKKQLESKEEECKAIVADLETRHKNKQDFLIARLKNNEKMFQKELDTQVRQIKQSWSWRIIHFILLPLTAAKSIFYPLINLVSQTRKIIHRKFHTNSFEKDSLADFDFYNQVKNENNLNIAGIFDKFTESCFGSEFNIITFTPQNWEKVLEHTPVKAFFMESAWRGIGGTWKNKLANIDAYNQRSVLRLIRHIKEKQIPCIFWNKEDPVHFEEFVSIAKEFDFIFTTDADCIPDYQSAAGHNNVYALPFAAQPGIHNPVRDFPRSGNVCFAGTYYARKYAERRGDMDFLLQPALEFGLDIFDRNYGTAASKAGIYKFPDIYQNNIKGRLDYDDMVKAYKKYKVFLNVNSVRYSPTMFARRVFELLACGTPVISTYSQGILNIFGEDTVLISESEEETRKHLENLTQNQDYWWKISLAGMRKVLTHHTYNDRVHGIFSRVGLPFQPYQWTTFTVAARIKSTDHVRTLKEMLDSQVYSKFEIILFESQSAPFTEEDREWTRNLFKDKLRDILTLDYFETGRLLARIDQNDYVAFMNPDCFYGRHFLEDYALAARYANPAYMGKGTFYTLTIDQLQIANEGFEYTFCSSAPNETMAVHHSRLNSVNFTKLLEPGIFALERNEVFSLDPFNFIRKEHLFQSLTKENLHKIES